MERAVTVAGIQPPPVRNHAVWTGGWPVYGGAGFVEHDPLKWLIEADGPLECEQAGVDDLYTLVGLVGQIVFRAF